MPANTTELQGEQQSAFMDAENVYNKKTQAVPKPDVQIGVDTNQTFYQNIIEQGATGNIDMSVFESFFRVAQGRDEIYSLMDVMGEDSTIAAILETYAEDATEYNEEGHIMWAESNDNDVAKYINFLLDSMSVDKHAYKWIYALAKYGDLYLRLYRKSDCQDDDLFSESEDDQRGGRKELKEDVKIKAYSKNDHYIHYLGTVPNPAEMFELTKLDKSYAYIEAEINSLAQQRKTGTVTNELFYKYNFKQKDIKIYGPTTFVHACLEDNSSRVPEKVTIFKDDMADTDKSDAYTYTVRRGQSLLYPTFKIWRELSLLENVILLNRVTKSAIVRVIGVEVGDMPKEMVAPHLQRIKSLFEQKSNIKAGTTFGEYTNPGPVENSVYVPTRGGVGTLTTQEVGGSVDVGKLSDLDYFQDKFFGAVRIPKQYFGCLRGNTEILLLNGEKLTIEEMFNNRDKYLGRGIMGCAVDGSLRPTIIENISLTKKHTNFIRIHLDNGEYVDVTPDHGMMMRDGTFYNARDIVVGDSLMPYYDKIDKGRRYVLDNKKGKYYPQYRVVAESVCDIPKGYQVHHKDTIKINDDFDNLEPLTVAEHYEKHTDMLHDRARYWNLDRASRGEHSRQYGKIGINNGIENRWIDYTEELPEGFTRGHIHSITDSTRKTMSEKRLKVLEEHPEYKHLGGFAKGRCPESTRLKISEKALQRYASMSEEERQNHREIQSALAKKNLQGEVSYNKRIERIPSNRRLLQRFLRCPVCGNIFVKKLNQEDYEAYLNRERFYFCCDAHRKEIFGGGKLNLSYKLLQECQGSFDLYEQARYNQDNRSDCFFYTDKLRDIYDKYLVDYVPECNHKVVAIEYLNIDEPAYDIKVADECHTFALPCGIFVHNCTDDAAGFSGGQSLAIISSRYAKMVKRLQNSLIQSITDAINLMLIDAGLSSYINRFTIKMTPPVTQEELDRREAAGNKVRLAADVMNLFNNDIEDPVLRLKALKETLTGVYPGSDIPALIQEAIDKVEAEQEPTTPAESANEDSLQDINIDAGDINIDSEDDLDSLIGLDTEETSEEAEPTEEEGSLPSMDELGNIDFTDNNNPAFNA